MKRFKTVLKAMAVCAILGVLIWQIDISWIVTLVCFLALLAIAIFVFSDRVEEDKLVWLRESVGPLLTAITVSWVLFLINISWDIITKLCGQTFL